MVSSISEGNPNVYKNRWKAYPELFAEFHGNRRTEFCRRPFGIKCNPMTKYQRAFGTKWIGGVRLGRKQTEDEFASDDLLYRICLL